MRKSSTQIPSFLELQKILNAESKRTVPKTKIDKKYFTLTSIDQLYTFFGLDNKFNKITKVSEFLKWSEESKVELINRLQNMNISPPLLSLLNDCYDYLSEDDDTKKIAADTIFVFGSASSLRIERQLNYFNRELVKL